MERLWKNWISTRKIVNISETEQDKDIVSILSYMRAFICYQDWWPWMAFKVTKTIPRAMYLDYLWNSPPKCENGRSSFTGNRE